MLTTLSSMCSVSAPSAHQKADDKTRGMSLDGHQQVQRNLCHQRPDHALKNTAGLIIVAFKLLSSR